MAKPRTQQAKEQTAPVAQVQMTLEQSRAYRAALHKPVVKVMNETQKREAFRVFWACNKAKYGKNKSLERAIWLHLKSIKMDSPEQFAQGLQNFGLKKVK
jgi:hypothetical protein